MRPSTPRRLLLRLLAVSVVSGALALTSTGTTARASATAVGSVEVTSLSLPIYLSCLTGCGFVTNATSSGAIAGVDGTTPFEASWTNSNFAATVSYVSSCFQSVWENANLNGTTATISGVKLLYGGTTYTGASVTLWFGGILADGAFAAVTGSAQITGGPSTIQIDLPAGSAPGAMAVVPPASAILCPSDLQTFTANGTLVTFGEPAG